MPSDDPDSPTGPAASDGEQRSPAGKLRLQQRLDVSDAVLADAVALYDRVEEADLRGVDTDAVPIAVVYIAIRQRGVARNIEEVAAAADVATPELYRTARAITDRLDRGIPPAEPELYVGRLADETGVPEPIERRALEVLTVADEAGLYSGRNPAGLAAAAIYTALAEAEDDPSVTQRELSDASSVGTVTIRNSYQAMADLLDD
ncbi:hypothetical protein ACKVMT_17830 [Halobacteriales archaeon Cl-PHB]